jgi:glutamate--cysteine ligase
VFEDGFGYEHYADYALDVPMYFVYRDGQIYRCRGLSFRDFLAGGCRCCPARSRGWVTGRTICPPPFPEVRMKGYLEMRGADGGRWDRICALPALWVGLLYDQTALDAAWDLVKHWTPRIMPACAARCRHWRWVRPAPMAARCRILAPRC